MKIESFEDYILRIAINQEKKALDNLQRSFWGKPQSNTILKFDVDESELGKNKEHAGEFKHYLNVRH